MNAMPNVLLIVLDDLGFSDLGCFGSEIETPNIDSLAAEGLRFNGFHVTPLCSPTRATLLTGRDHHSVGMGRLADQADPTDAKGYNGLVPESAATVARVLQDAGYGTYAVGKWHLAPDHQCGPDGPFERWPLGMGFQRHYGFQRGMTDQWVPDLVQGNESIEPPRLPSEGYHLSEDLVDHALQFLEDHDRESPFFLYFAPAAVHAPHQAPREWVDRYTGAFDHGWDVERERRLARQKAAGLVPPRTELTVRPAEVPAWTEITPRERDRYSSQMEKFAGYLSHIDDQIGRLLRFLDESDRLDDTIVVVVSDNGADGAWSEGYYDGYVPGWAVAGNTPFRRWKWHTWLGGTRVPLVIRWPQLIPSADEGEVRQTFVHSIDVMPTLLDLANVPIPAAVDGVRQQPIDGRSFAGALTSPDVDGRSTQYFEMAGSRAIYHEGWMATTDHVPAANVFTELEGSRSFDEDRWSLFDLRTDFSQAHDLAQTHPMLVRDLEEIWTREAQRAGVFPLTDRIPPDWVDPKELGEPQQMTVDGSRAATGRLLSGDVTITASIEGGMQPVRGVLFAWYFQVSGLYLPEPEIAVTALDGLMRLRVRGDDHTSTSADLPLRLGAGERAAVTVRQSQTGDRRRVRLTIGNGSATVETVRHLPTYALRSYLLKGKDHGHPKEDYSPPFAFTARIRDFHVRRV